MAIIPFFKKGFFTFHDNIQVQRVFEMTKALTGGMFPVRWSMDLGFGFGYPVFNFYAPLAYYVGGFINLAGFDSLTATKIMIAFGIILSSLTMFVFAKEIFGKRAGFLASVLYVFAPYHALDIYVRGDVGEIWAYAFIPLVFYAIYKQYKSLNTLNILIGGLAFAALILSHNLTALMFTPFILIFIILLSFLKKEKRQSMFLFAPLVLGLLLSAFYWIPAILEMNFTNVTSQIGGGADYKDHFVCLYQLWTSPWGFGGSVPGCVDGLSFMIGKLHLIFALLALVIYIFSLKVKKVSKGYVVLTSFFVISFFVSVFLMIDYSKFVWDVVKPMAFFQYPWRFLIPATFFITMIATGGIYYLEALLKKTSTKWFIILVLIISVTTFLFNVKFFVPQKFIYVKASDYTSRSALVWTASRISSEYMPKGFQKPGKLSKIPQFSSLNSKDISVYIVKQKTHNIELKVDVLKSGKFVFPIAYFPSWKAYLDSKEVKLIPTSTGVLIYLPLGQHILSFVFVQTPVEFASDMLTLAGILIIIIGIINKRFRYDKIT